MRPTNTPVMFIGHGSPATILTPDAYHLALTNTFKDLSPHIKAIVVLSAHWLTENEINISTQLDQETIYDFYGFSEELNKIKYKARGDAELAKQIAENLKIVGLPIFLDPKRGLDHGAWEPLAIAYPNPKVPVFQISLPYPSNEQVLMKMGEALKPFRSQGVLFIGSGDLVHNLRDLYWNEPNGPVVPWAFNFENWILKHLDNQNWSAVLKWQTDAPESKRAHPTPDHLYPLFPILGATGKDEKLTYIYKGFQMRTISVTSFYIS